MRFLVFDFGVHGPPPFLCNVRYLHRSRGQVWMGATTMKGRTTPQSLEAISGTNISRGLTVTCPLLSYAFYIMIC
eukprot:368612-Rhodomonas_salina.4